MSKILYNIKRVTLELLNESTGLVDNTKKPVVIDTAEEAKLKALVSKGDEKILRTEDRIVATATQPDLTYGYEIELKDNTFSIEILSLVEGGTILYDETDTKKIVGYESPLLDDGSLCKPFKADIYVEERKGSSRLGYVQFTLNYCLGKAPEFEFKKGEFYSPTFTIDARENTIANKPIKSIAFIKELPTISNSGKQSK